jgi:hypothetical protein
MMPRMIFLSDSPALTCYSVENTTPSQISDLAGGPWKEDDLLSNDDAAEKQLFATI